MGNIVTLEPGLRKMRNVKMHAYTRVWRANKMQFSGAYDTIFFSMHMIHSFRVHDTHLPHNPNPTHCVAYTCQSPFLRINTMSFCFYLAYYLYVLSWDQVEHCITMSIARTMLFYDNSNIIYTIFTI